MDRQRTDGSGVGVFFGIVLAIAIVVGAYFFIQNRNMDNTALEPAAGTEAPATGGMMGGEPSNTPAETAPAR